MCLTIKWWSIKRIALKDIECYKVVMIDKQLPKMYRTVYQGTIVEIGKTYTSDIIRGKLGSYDSPNSVTVALHSYTDVERAMFEKRFGWQRVVVRCIIPRGSRYYVGKFAGCKSYASNRLKYVEKVV